jgi:hypothetical protein
MTTSGEAYGIGIDETGPCRIHERIAARQVLQLAGVLLWRQRKSAMIFPGVRSRAAGGLGGRHYRGFRMNQTTTRNMRSLARDLIAFGMSRNKSSGIEAPPGFYVTETLRPHLANLMGLGGFQALFSRALVLASTEVSWLSALRVKADGSLEGLEAAQSRLAKAEFLEGRIVLLAQLLGLLVAFIGPALTSQLMREIWPNFHSKALVSAGKE